jgi:HD-GYP domain-containing protein (c-di-GMP phosphodiesterase class II)
VPNLRFRPPSQRSLKKAPLPSLRIKQLEQALRQTEAGAVCALTLLLDLKDLKTGMHATRLAEWAVRVGEELGLGEEELRDVEYASMLHDIGKVGVSDEVLLKPGRLTDEEFEQVKKHPEYGWAILRAVPGLERVSLLVLHHHERMDGAGYPAGLEGDQIPLGSRIVCVVDAFDAMLSSRSYRKGLGIEEALRRLRASSPDQFDPRIVAPFIDLAVSDYTEIAKLEESAA